MAGRTVIGVVEDRFTVNGVPTYLGRSWKGMRIEGLLMNSRMIQATFDDLNPATRGRWSYPDTGTWDPDRHTDEFIAAVPEWKRHGLLAVTLNFQGGNPERYAPEQPWHNSTFTEGGEMRPAYLARMKRVLDRIDELGMAAIVGIFYFGQDRRLKGEREVVRALDGAVDWLHEGGWRNVLVEVNNECDIKYTHEILKPERVHELIERVKSRDRNGVRFLAGTSYGGGAVARENVVRASDFVLMHGNGVQNPGRIGEMVREVRRVPGYRRMPVLFNEDDHFDFDKPRCNLSEAVREYASWGYFDPGANNYWDGYQSPPVSWGINSGLKRAFFDKLREVTGA